MRNLAAVLIIGVSFLVACGPKSEQVKDLSEPLNEQAGIQYQFAYEFFQQGDLIRSLAAGLKAVELAPRNPDAHNLLGLIYFRKQEYQAAEASFAQALKLNPRMSEAYNNLGSLFYEQERYADAEGALNAALENPLYLYPERIYNNLGLVYEATNRGDRAREAYERAIALRQDYYLPYLNLGSYWLKKDEAKRAKTLLKEASRLCGKCAEPQYQLAQALVSENQMKEAVKAFRAGYEAEPKSYYGQLCRQFLVEHGSLKDE